MTDAGYGDDGVFAGAVPSLPGLLPGAPGARRLARPRATSILQRAASVRNRKTWGTTTGAGIDRIRFQLHIDAHLADAIDGVVLAEGLSRAAGTRALLTLGLWAYDRLASLQPTEAQLASSLKEHPLPR